MGGKNIGLIGLGVMGQSLALNLQRHGFGVAVFNRTPQKTKEFTSRHPEIMPTYSLEAFVRELDTPRRVLLMLTAGPAVDETIRALTPLLSRGDVVMDGGNSFFQDTERRAQNLEAQGLHFLGIGVSGGEEGALKGPCLMVGGPTEGYGQVSRILTKIAAQADGPCCEYLGPRGAGHYVKMVHNAIEYAIIQIIAEAYDFLTRAGELEISKVREIFDEWNHGELGSFLFEIAVEVLGKMDEEKRVPLVTLVSDRAGQKGTGRWASQNAMDLGVPVPTIDAAVAARNLSAMKDERLNAAKVLGTSRPPTSRFHAGSVESFRAAVEASVIVSYAQGFHLMSRASEHYGYSIPLGKVARIWKGGCIIRAKMLDPITHALESEEPRNLIVSTEFAGRLIPLDPKWREAVKQAKAAGIPIPAINASLDYCDAYRSERLPANIIQALRDRFGAHGYERIDKAGNFHTNWSN